MHFIINAALVRTNSIGIRIEIANRIQCTAHAYTHSTAQINVSPTISFGVVIVFCTHYVQRFFSCPLQISFKRTLFGNDAFRSLFLICFPSHVLFYLSHFSTIHLFSPVSSFLLRHFYFRHALLV